MDKNQKIGLILIGDELLSGWRQDKHFAKVIEILKARELSLSWARILPDDIDALVETFKQTFAKEQIVFVCGGIGATPDDKTREAVATALGLPLELNKEAASLISGRFQTLADEGRGTIEQGTPENQRRLALGVFPVGAEIVPNPYNNIPGFFIKDHTFAPGFPEMAWPMIEWTLDTRYANLQPTFEKTCSIIAYHLVESRITGTLEHIEKEWPEIKTFSLPSVPKNGNPGFIEIGVKGNSSDLEKAFSFLKGEILRVGGHFSF